MKPGEPKENREQEEVQPESMEQILEAPETKEKTEDQLSPEDKIFKIEDFLVEPDKDYSNLLNKVQQESNLEHWSESALFTIYTRYLREILFQEDLDADREKERKKAVEFFKNRLNGKILVDLGSGSSGHIRRLAAELGVKTYIGVDKFAEKFTEGAQNANEDPYKDLSLGENYKDTQMVTVKADMLDFLSRLPNNSVSITINGIDSALIPTDDYHRAISKELERVTSKDGIVFGKDSTSLDIIAEQGDDKENEKSSLKEREFPVFGGRLNVFEKVK